MQAYGLQQSSGVAHGPPLFEQHIPAGWHSWTLLQTLPPHTAHAVAPSPGSLTVRTVTLHPLVDNVPLQLAKPALQTRVHSPPPHAGVPLAPEGQSMPPALP